MNEMQFATLRKAMVDSQIRPNKVIDVQVIEAFSRVPRELFVSRQMQELAYIDEDIHLSGGRFIIEAMVMARMIQALNLIPSDNVMCIGAGTGYGAAIMSSLAASVIAIETRTQMVEKASKSLRASKLVMLLSLNRGYKTVIHLKPLIRASSLKVAFNMFLRPCLINCQMVDIWCLFCALKILMLVKPLYGTNTMAT